MRTIAVTSGKGGVGKSNISANLGIAFQKTGTRTIVFDADLGLANLDVILGARAAYTLQNVISGEKTVSEIVASGPGGIGFIAGGSGVQSLINLSGPALERFLAEIADLESDTDCLIFDTGAGVDDSVMSFCEAADEIILVGTADPASLTDAYATAKTIFSRKPNAKIHVLLNMVTSFNQGELIFERLNEVVGRFLNKKLHFLGSIRKDETAAECVRRRKPYFFAAPNSNASQDLWKIAQSLAGDEAGKQTDGFVSRLRSVFGFTLKKSA